MFPDRKRELMRKKCQAPWMTKEIRNLIKGKRNACRKLKRVNNSQDHKMYTREQQGMEEEN